jgi:hypothetical protein
LIIPVVLLALTPLPAAAQEAPPIALTLSPEAAPIPALKYKLLPELRDLKSGNAAQLYYRSFSPEWQHFRQDRKFQEKVTELADKPLRDLRRADFDPFAGVLSSRTLQELDRAARRTWCDWELLDRVREDGIGLLLPDLQGFRESATLLRARAKMELLEGRYDKAVRTIQTGLAMARDVAKGPTLIHGLVGVAMAAVMLQVVEDWVERPDAPNLYWALTNLPHPLIDVRNGFEGERLFIDNLFPGYREMLADLAAPPSSARVQTTLQQYAGMLSLGDGQQKDPWNLEPLLAALRAYPAAKRMLREQGRSAEQIEAMPALQAVFLYEVNQYDLNYDELLKWLGLPYYEAAPQMHRAVQRFGSREGLRSNRSTLARLILPAVEKVVAAPARVERKVAALRCVEALRLYAASHGGRLPEKLEEVSEVPLPRDPWTGKAFNYRLEGGKATLSGGPLPDQTPNAGNNFRYVLTLRPAKAEKDEKTEKTPAREAKTALAGRAGALAALLDEEAFAVVRIDATRVDAEGLLKTVRPLLEGRKPDLVSQVKEIRESLAAFTRAGGTELIVVFSTADLPEASFAWVPLKDGADVAALTRLLKKVPGLEEHSEKRGDVLVAGSKEALARLGKGKPAARPELAPALEAAGESAVQVLLLPTPDQRRVVEEVVRWPGVSGKTLTEGVRWAALGLEVGPKPSVRLTVQAADAAGAKKMAGLVELGFTLLGKVTFPGEEKPLKELFPKEFATVTEALAPTVTGARLTIQMREPAPLAAAVKLALGIEEYSAGLERSSLGFNMKQILLALHNYHDTYGTLPAHAIYSKAGKPLLSWRVAILPYLEQDALYKEFHLDEPWDSPHNKKLIDKMPAIFRSPKLADRRPGLTTYLAPVNKAFVFTGDDKGLQLAAISDGTSNTAILVDVADETGVIWTKPDDLVVNEKDPWKGLLGHYPTYILVGMGDGTVQRVVKSVPGKTLWALFTRDGGEVLPDLSK